MLDIEALFELEETLKDELNNHLEEILVKLNRTDKLEDFLRLIGMQELLGLGDSSETFNDGQIIVIGNSEVDKEKLCAVAKNMGFNRDRFEFYLDYEDAKKFDFKKTQWSTKYSCILVGPMPHSGIARLLMMIRNLIQLQEQKLFLIMRPCILIIFLRRQPLCLSIP